MGYLDNSTITVDAILTKQGRLKISHGQPLNISYFTLSDTGVDYTTWNPGHPSGSAFYGEAIESLPNLEAMSNAAYFMQRNTLVTLHPETTAMPFIDNIEDWDFADMFNPHVWNPTLENAPFGESGGQTSMTLLVPRDDVINGMGQEGVDIGGNMLQFLSYHNIENAKMYTVGGSFSIEPQTNVEATKVIHLILVDNGTGTWNSFKITVDNNARKARTMRNPLGDWGG